MPIRKDLLPLYRTPEYEAARASLVARAGNKCEQCGKPNGATVETFTDYAMGFLGRRGLPVMFWRPVGYWWVTQSGVMAGTAIVEKLKGKKIRTIRVVCTFAHLDHNPANNAEENKAFLCQWCHLNYDAGHHKHSRSVRKDRGRPLLV